MTAAIVILACWITLLVAKDTPAGRFLNHVMVLVPARAFNRLEPGHVALATVVTLLVILHLSAGNEDPVRMVAVFAPDVSVWLGSIELSAIVEAAFGLVAALAASSRRSLAAAIKPLFIRRPRHPKNKADRARSGPGRSRILPANDDEDGAEFALAS